MRELANEKNEEMKPNFNEKKTTQAAVLLLKLNNGKMSYMKLVKLLYNIDRECLKRWARPVTYDDFYSMPHGLVVSATLDKAEDSAPIHQTYWNNYIKTNGYKALLIEDCGDDELSPAEEALIIEMDKVYKNKTQFDMEREHHNPDLFPEYVDPNGSSIKTSYREVLEVLGFSRDDVAEIMMQMAEQSAFDEAFA